MGPHVKLGAAREEGHAPIHPHPLTLFPIAWGRPTTRPTGQRLGVNRARVASAAANRHTVLPALVRRVATGGRAAAVPPPRTGRPWGLNPRTGKRRTPPPDFCFLPYATPVLSLPSPLSPEPSAATPLVPARARALTLHRLALRSDQPTTTALASASQNPRSRPPPSLGGTSPRSSPLARPALGVLHSSVH